MSAHIYMLDAYENLRRIGYATPKQPCSVVILDRDSATVEATLLTIEQFVFMRERTIYTGP